MFRKIAAALAALLASTAFAAVDVNKASQAELEAIPGVGPATSTMIIDERKKSEFKDWTDLVRRVQGVGDRSAAKFSEGGLTVGGKPYVSPAAKATAPAKAASSAKTGTKAKASDKKADKGTVATAASAPKK